MKPRLQYLYQGDNFHFMDTTSYEQIHISRKAAELTRAEAGSPASCQARSARTRCIFA